MTTLAGISLNEKELADFCRILTDLQVEAAMLQRRCMEERRMPLLGMSYMNGGGPNGIGRFMTYIKWSWNTSLGDHMEVSLTRGVCDSISLKLEVS
jgi:hypothetical protein